MTRIRKLGLTVAIISGLAGIMGTAQPVRGETLTIGATHSLRAPFQEILPLFEKEYGMTARVVYGASQTLRRQIEHGEAIDVFLSESIEEVEKLYQQGLTLNGKPRVYAQTSLVLVMSAASRATSISFHDVVPNRARMALADPKTSVLGEITARMFTTFDPAYKTGSNFLYGQHSLDIMNLVQTGKADVGVVYRSDAINSGHVRIIDEAPAGSYTTIKFGHAVVWTCRSDSRPAADEFLDFLLSPRVQKLLLKYGFDAVPLTE